MRWIKIVYFRYKYVDTCDFPFPLFIFKSIKIRETVSVLKQQYVIIIGYLTLYLIK